MQIKNPQSEIAHFEFMSDEAKKAILAASSIHSSGFQAISGKSGRKSVWLAGAFFDGQSRKWHVKSLGDGAMIDLWGPLYAAVEMGAAAFHNGKSPAPGPEFDEAFPSNGEVGSRIPAMKAFSNGWHLANIEAEVPS